jgi:hypothetical protein
MESSPPQADALYLTNEPAKKEKVTLAQKRASFR